VSRDVQEAGKEPSECRQRSSERCSPSPCRTRPAVFLIFCLSASFSRPVTASSCGLLKQADRHTPASSPCCLREKVPIDPHDTYRLDLSITAAPGRSYRARSQCDRARLPEWSRRLLWHEWLV